MSLELPIKARHAVNAATFREYAKRKLKLSGSAYPLNVAQSNPNRRHQAQRHKRIVKTALTAKTLKLSGQEGAARCTLEAKLQTSKMLKRVKHRI